MAGTATPLRRINFSAKRRRPIGRWLGYTAAILVTILLLGALGGYVYARRSLPVIEGELALAGLKAPVTVYRDDRGIPHIEASSEHDLYMAQGYITAQDRLFQMDLSRRAASGRLAEIVGEAALDMDKLYRTLSLRRAAEASVKSYSPWALGLLEAYSAGVNAYITEATKAGRLPVEFTLLGYKPEPWSPVDSASIGKYMADDLTDSMATEIFYHELRRKVGLELTNELLPAYPDAAPTIMKYTGKAAAAPQHQTAAASAPYASDLDLSGLLAMDVWPDPFVGSNNWVVAGSLTKSGKPLLANDPHLSIGTPSIWHEVHLVLNQGDQQMNAFGVIFPGAPGIVIGQNDKVAWGVTNVNPDVQDLYIEKRNPANPYQFLYKEKWEDATVYKELIPVKGKEPVELEVVVTRHGPIVSEVIGSPKERPSEAMALKWTAHLGTPELEAVLRFTKAQNWTEFREAIRYFQAPTQNFVFAAVDGTIAYRTGGIIPIRAKGDGLFPVEGWTGEHEWTGFIPFDQMPEVVNPKEGYIATANHRVIDPSYPYHITYHNAQPFRAQRIIEVLEAKKGQMTVDDMEALQVDYHNLQARTLLPAMLPVLEKSTLSKLEQDGLALLKGWNHVDSADQGAPLIFQFWMRHLQLQLYGTKMGEELHKQMKTAGNVTDMMILDAARGKEGTWIKEAGGFAKLLLSSYQKAIAEVAALQGKNAQKWAWGKYHVFAPNHQLGAAVPALGYLLNPKARPVGGSGVTVAQMGFKPNGQVKTAAPWRQVVDLANPTGNSRSIVTPGQSGHFLSKWYDDQAETHNQGKLFPRNFQGYATGKKLVLKPS